MIRFLPDTWLEALLRPLAMAAPDGHVYVEIMAPDLRFVFAIVLAILLLLLRKRLAAQPRGTLMLFAIVALSFVPWLATSGNGRYFLPSLMAVGPLAVGLACALPATRAAKAACVIGMIGLQASVVFDTTPWRSWSLTTWKERPYFDLPLPAEFKQRPATYVTMTSISYSLLAPQFHPASHWMNISSMLSDPRRSLETRMAQAILARSSERYVLLPSMPDYMTPQHLPNAQLQDVIDHQLVRQRLALDRASACRFLPSHRLAQLAKGEDLSQARPETVAKLGFWICPLRYPVTAPQELPPQLATDAVFEKVEHDCPRFFPPGQTATTPLTDGDMRNYAGADMKLYVMHDGAVYYKYWRALNPVRIGSIGEVMGPGFQMDCANIRGRSGLPWQRSM